MWRKNNLPVAIFCLLLGTFVLTGSHAAKKMPTVETLFSAAYLDSPVFNLDDGSLWVSDIQNDRVLRLLDVSPKTDAAKRLAGTKGSNKDKKELADLVMSPSGRARGIAFDQRGRLVMCESGGRRVTRLEVDGKLTVLAEKIDNKRLNSPDDLVIDSKGRIYFTDPRFGARDDMDMVTEGVYRIDVDEYQGKHRVTRIMDNKYVKRPAGVVLSPDETKIYLVEAHPSSPRLVVFELKRDGTVVDAPPYIVHDFDKGKGGDGLCIDSHGNLYVAGGSNSQSQNPAGVYAFSPEGTHLGFMPIPEDAVVSCRFGGWDMRTLYVTAGGGIYQARMPIPGFNANFYPREDEEREVHVWEDEPPPPSPTPAATPCPIDERVSENGMLRERIAELEQELAAQEQWIREREQKLKELAEGSSAQGLPRRRRRRRLVRRRPDDYDDYEYDDDYPDHDDYDDYDDRRRGGRRRYADEEWEEWEAYDDREVPQPSRGLSPNGGGGAINVGNGLRRPPQPVKRREAIRQVKGEDPEQGGQTSRGGATDRRSDVRHIFERGYDEL